MAGLVHVIDEVPELAGHRPVLVHALEGFFDAGSATRIVGEHLAQQPGRVVASFDVDALYDYRGRRPPLTFSVDHYLDFAAPRLVVRLVHDLRGEPLLVLTGPEPDYRWEGFIDAVEGLLDRFDVSLTVGVGGVPMALPHTRPLLVTAHSPQPERLREPNLWKAQVRVPSSAAAVLELRLGERGRPAMGFVVHVPHYLTQTDYPQAAQVLLGRVEEATGLTFDHSALDDAADQAADQVDELVAASNELLQAVTAMEQQYDTFTRASAEGSLLAEEGPLPSADELAAEFERFLARQDRPDGLGDDSGEER